MIIKWSQDYETILIQNKKQKSTLKINKQSFIDGIFEMNPSKNEVTGDFIITGSSNNSYRSGWDLIWGNKKNEETKIEVPPELLDENGDEE